MKEMAGSLDYAFHFDWLLIVATYVSGILFLSIGILFLLICRKHYLRYKRERLNVLVVQLIEQYCQVTNSTLRQKIITQLRLLSKEDYLNFLMLWMWLSQQAGDKRISVYTELANQIELYAGIGVILNSSSIDSKVIALKVIGNARLNEFTSEVEGLPQDKVITRIACHTLVKLEGGNAIPFLLGAHEKGFIHNTELLVCFSELSLPEIELWESQHPGIHFPQIVVNYLWSNTSI